MRRGLKISEDQLADFLDRYSKGRIVTHHSFTHSTRKSEVPDEYRGNVELVIEPCHGKHIAPWSRYPVADDEVAFRLGTRFRVDEAEEVDGIYLIRLQELEEAANA